MYKVCILFVCWQMYKVRPRRTLPQGLLMFCMILMFLVLAINVILYELTPQYSSFGSQHYLVWCCWCWSLLYGANLRSRADSLRLCVILHEWLASYSRFLNIHRSGVLSALTWLVPHVTAAVSVCSVYTIQPGMHPVLSPTCPAVPLCFSVVVVAFFLGGGGGMNSIGSPFRSSQVEGEGSSSCAASGP